VTGEVTPGEELQPSYVRPQKFRKSGAWQAYLGGESRGGKGSAEKFVLIQKEEG